MVSAARDLRQCFCSVCSEKKIPSISLSGPSSLMVASGKIWIISGQPLSCIYSCLFLVCDCIHSNTFSSVFTASEGCQYTACHCLQWGSWHVERLLCVCLSALGCIAVLVRLWSLAFPCTGSACSAPPSSVCQRQFGLIYRPLTHNTLDPTFAAGMAIPCAGVGSTWVVLHWWGSDVVLLMCSRGTCTAVSVEMYFRWLCLKQRTCSKSCTHLLIYSCVFVQTSL